MSDSAAGRIEMLRSIPIFADLDDASLQHILECVSEFEVKPGHVLVQPNHAGEGLFLIEEGTVLVEVPGKRIELGPGEFFGEIALLTEDAVRRGRVSAHTDLRCLALRREDFDDLLEQHPKVALSMLRALARRLTADS